MIQILGKHLSVHLKGICCVCLSILRYTDDDISTRKVIDCTKQSMGFYDVKIVREVKCSRCYNMTKVG